METVVSSSKLGAYNAKNKGSGEERELGAYSMRKLWEI